MLQVATPRRRMPAPPSRARFLFLMPYMATLLRTAALAAPAALLAGCTIDWNAFADSTTGSPNMSRPSHHLPQPSVRKFPLPALDAAGMKRLLEVEQFVADQYKAAGWQIMETIQTESGDLYDWIDVNSIEGADEAPPPPMTPDEMQLPEGAELQLTDLDVEPDLQRPAGAVPVRRPEFAPYVLGESDASSLDEFLTEEAVPGDASHGNDRLYAGIVTAAPNRGASVSISAFSGGRIEAGTLSVLEIVVGCPNDKGEMWQYIGIAASRDYATQNFVNFGDSTLRIQVEFFTQGSNVVDKKKGGWHGTKSLNDFILVPGAPYAPGFAIPRRAISTIGGTQYESLFHIQWFNGNWWVGYNGHWLGHYPKELFDKYPPNLIEKQACRAMWYGEVYANSKQLDKEGRPWTWTDMGSGEFAEKGWTKAAYFRDPSYLSPAGTWSWPDSDPKTVADMPPPLYNPGCYTKTPLQPGPAPGQRFFYVGGPGAPAADIANGSPTCK
jgi:hypothetical protein